jgi:hypothetical protein
MGFIVTRSDRFLRFIDRVPSFGFFPQFSFSYPAQMQGGFLSSSRFMRPLAVLKRINGNDPNHVDRRGTSRGIARSCLGKRDALRV